MIPGLSQTNALEELEACVLSEEQSKRAFPAASLIMQTSGRRQISH